MPFGPADSDQICVDGFTLLAQDKWPLLSLLGLSLSGVSGCVEILASASWPCLLTVILEVHQITDAGVPALVQAAWPNIRHLSMSGWFENMQWLSLCMNKWPPLWYTLRGSSFTAH